MVELTTTSRVIGTHGLTAEASGVALELRLPWYRSLPLSTVEVSAVEIDGVAIADERVRFELEGRTYALGALREQPQHNWYVLDSAFLLIDGVETTPGAKHRIAVTVTLYPPYIAGLKRPLREEKTVTVRPSRESSKQSAITHTGPRMGSTLYAFTNEFLSRRYSFEGLLHEIADRQIGPGVEVVGFQSFRDFPNLSDRTVEEFRALVEELGLEPTSLGINADQEILRGKPLGEDEMVAYHEPQIRAAARLGFPIVRYQYGAGPNVIRRLAPLAEDLGVKLGLEIHSPQHAEDPIVLAYREMYAQVNSSALGWIPDFSSTARMPPPSFLRSFLERGASEKLVELANDAWQQPGDGQERMAEFARRAEAEGHDPLHYNALGLIFTMYGNKDPKSWMPLMDRVIHIHGKFFGFDEDGREEAIDYETLLPMFRDAGFNGTISSEWEGHAYSNADAFMMVEQHQAMCRRILGSSNTTPLAR